MIAATCLYCEDAGTLTFVIGQGWVHQQGGTYMMRCPDCGWKGALSPSPVHCPRCGSKALRDDHCATPRFDVAPVGVAR